MRNKVLVTIFTISIGLAVESTVRLEKTSLFRFNGSINMHVQAKEEIMGVQFDMKYNMEELQFIGANSILNDYVFEYVEKDNGVIRGIMFSWEGEKINKNYIESIISFDFMPVKFKLS